jgi:hypothetical protein
MITKSILPDGSRTEYSSAEKNTQAYEERCQIVAMFVIMFWPGHVCRENRNQEIEEKVASYALYIHT